MRVNFPFALENIGIHLGNVIDSAVAGRTVIESIGIRVNADERELAADHAFKHLPEMLVLIGETHIRPDLRSGIAKPHGMDVSRVYECPEVSVFIFAEVHRGVKSIGKTVAEHPSQIWVLQLRLHLNNLIFNNFRREQAIFFGRTLRCVVSSAKGK